MSFSISPDGTKIAYTKQHDQPSVIYIRDLSTGVQKTAYVLNRSINYFIVGDIRWSPTGNRIAFQTQDSNYTVQTIYLNLLTMKQRVIQEYKVYSFDFQGWADDGKLEFKEFGKTDVQIIQIDVSNDKLVVVGTPTPSP
jgi:Tol biopolymer transport system component